MFLRTVVTFTFTALCLAQAALSRSPLVGALTGQSDIESVATFQAAQPNNRVARREVSAYNKRVELGYCDSDQARFITRSYRDAKGLAARIAHYLGSSEESGGELFTMYFGNSSTADVYDMFKLAASDDDETRVIYCDSPQAYKCSLNDGTIAYTFGPPIAPEIHVCPLFFDQEPTEALCDRDPVDSGGFASGAILRELIRATSAMFVDFGSGCSADQDLAAMNPEMALYNADNYSCFAAEFYRLTEC